MNSHIAEKFGAAYEYSGFWIRFGASLIDIVILIAITFPMLYMIYGETLYYSEDFILGGADFIISYVMPFVATILFWMYKSATPGKMAVKAIIVDFKTGNAPTIKQSIIRYFGYMVSMIPLCLGFIWVCWDNKKQGWHDKMAGTVVIHPKTKG